MKEKAKGHDSLERRFANFRRTGDHHALETVYGDTAGEILRVANFLTRNRDRAEDLLQDTWLQVIKSKDTWSEDKPLMPWLLGVLTNCHYRQRAQVRRHQKQVELPVSVAKDPVGAAMDDEFKTALEGALTKVRDPYRTVLRKTLLEGLMPAEIAKETGSKPGTVSVHLNRGMDLLRKAIPVGFAGGAAAILAGSAEAVERIKQTVLEEAAKAPLSTGLPSAKRVSGAGMRKTLLLIGALVVLVLGVFLVLELDQQDLEELTASGGADPVADTKEPSPRQDDPDLRSTLAGKAKPADAGADQGLGSLEFIVQWANDESPAAHVAIRIDPIGKAVQKGYPSRVTGADGKAIFSDIPTGEYGVVFARGGSLFAEVFTGKKTIKTVPLPERGRSVMGRVVDAKGAFVPEAKIWHSTATNNSVGWVVSQADLQGNFVLRGLPFTCLLGARAPGHSPSSLTRIEWGEGIQETLLVLPGPGASLSGVVIDQEGNPVPGARIQVGDDKGWFGNAATQDYRAPSSLFFESYSDSEGRYLIQGLPLGWAPVIASASGYGNATEMLMLQAAVPASQTLTLQPAGSIYGVISRADGEPVDQVLVNINDGGRYNNRALATGPDGAYRFDGLLPGTYQLQVMVRFLEKLHVVQKIQASEVIQRNLVLQVGPELKGRLVGTDGKPLKNYVVRSRTLDGQPGSEALTGEDGDFVLGPCTGSAYEIFAKRVPEMSFAATVSREALVPNGKVHEVMVMNADPCLVMGHFVGVDGKPLGGASAQIIQAALHDFELPQTIDVRTGAFKIGPLAPGPYHLVLDAGKRGMARVEFKLEDGKNQDLGNVRAQSLGALVLDLRRVDGKEPWNTIAVVRRVGEDGQEGKLLTLYHDDIRLPFSLPTGTYSLETKGPETPWHRRLFKIRGGEDTRVRLMLPQAVARQLSLDFSEDVTWTAGSACVLRIQDGSGELAFERAFPSASVFWAKVDWPAFVIGRHTVEMEAANGAVKRGFFDVTELLPSADPIWIKMR